MKLFERLAKLREALGVDQVLSLYQVHKHFGLDLSGHREGELHVEHLYMSPVATNVFETCMVGIVTLNPRLSTQLTADQLAHMMGTAEIRLSLGIPVQEWKANAQALGQKLQPDAIWQKDAHTSWAVEYDSGAYKPSVVAEKVAYFSKNHQGTLWGTVTDFRVRRLQRLYGGQVRVINLRWWAPG